MTDKSKVIIRRCPDYDDLDRLRGMVAVDAVAARIIGFRSDEIQHLKIARSRGWQPVTDDQIELKSEVPWSEIEEKTQNFSYDFSDLAKIETPVRFHLGHYPGGDEPCFGGCINMLKGALAGFDAYRHGSLKRARPLAVVVGEYEGDVDGEGHPILLIGNCTEILGQAKGRTRRIKGCPVGIPVFTALAPYFLRVPSPLLGEPTREAFTFLAKTGRAYFNRVKNRVF